MTGTSRDGLAQGMVRYKGRLQMDFFIIFIGV